MRRTTAVLTAAAALTASAAATAALTPNALYTKILTSTLPTSALPAGFSGAKTTYQPMSARGRAHHEIGEVAFVIDGPDPNDTLSFEVFPNAADALGALHAVVMPPGDHVIGTVPGFPNSVLVTGSITGKNLLGKTVTDGLTDVLVIDGNVGVQIITDSTNPGSGDISAALALLHTGVKYLTAVERG